jgi:hypothetical protein
MILKINKMLISFITYKVLSHITDIDFERPSGKCGVCGHRTYMIKGSITEDVCPWCKLMRLLLVMKLPIDEINKITTSIEQKHKIKL